jgi:hypothetical protein
MNDEKFTLSVFLGWSVAICLLFGGLGFFAGREYERKQHDQINIHVPGFHYQQR